MEPNLSTTTPITNNTKLNRQTGLKTALIIISIIALCGIGFGIYGMMQSFNKDTEISGLKAQLEKATQSTTDPTDPTKTPNPIDTPDTKNILTIPEMGIAIKNLDQVGRIDNYTYDGVVTGNPDSPVASFQIFSLDGLPDVPTDSIASISGAKIYQYDANYFFDHDTICDVELGKLGEFNFCVERIPAEGFYAENEAWNTWAESNLEKLMKVLANPANYIVIE